MSGVSKRRNVNEQENLIRPYLGYEKHISFRNFDDFKSHPIFSYLAKFVSECFKELYNDKTYDKTYNLIIFSHNEIKEAFDGSVTLGIFVGDYSAYMTTFFKDEMMIGTTKCFLIEDHDVDRFKFVSELNTFRFDNEVGKIKYLHIFYNDPERVFNRYEIIYSDLIEYLIVIADNRYYYAKYSPIIFYLYNEYNSYILYHQYQQTIERELKPVFSSFANNLIITSVDDITTLTIINYRDFETYKFIRVSKEIFDTQVVKHFHLGSDNVVLYYGNPKLVKVIKNDQFLYFINRNM